MWVRSTLYAAGSDRKVTVMLLNRATMKETDTRYAEENARFMVLVADAQLTEYERIFKSRIVVPLESP
jgi:hypothetical protein